MLDDFSKIFHIYSKDGARGHQPIDISDEKWPIDWKKIYYKTYPRFKKIKLTHGNKAADFFCIVENRRSERVFRKRGVAIEDISILLKYSCGVSFVSNDTTLRVQPSAGARYPLEVYPIVLSGKDIDEGVYHYNPIDHSLDCMFLGEDILDSLKTILRDNWSRQASVIFVVTAVFHRNQIKYGERGYRHVLLEAGHIGHGMSLAAESLQLNCAISSHTNDRGLEKLLGIDGISESVVYTLFLD